MLRHHLAAALTIVLMLALQPSTPSLAQGPTAQDVQRLAVLADMRISIIQAIGAEPQTVDVSTTGKVLTIARINSNMNKSTHAGRDNEATAIARIASQAIAGKAEFKGTLVIRVEYEISSRLLNKTHRMIIDHVEFRADPNGLFQFHHT